jgi:proprotein convertase subtilisin/kexin type 5
LDGCTKITDKGSCLTCSSGYYFYQGGCQACHSSCKTCTDSSLCLTCNTGHYNGSNTHFSLCQPCSAGCLTCTSGSTCSACSSGYYLSVNTCLGCSTNCASCTSPICSTCNSVSVKISNTCYLCTEVSMQGSIGCLTCETNSIRVICKSCDSGYYLDTTLGQCATCASRYPNSIACTSTNVLQCSSDSAAILSSRFYLFNNACVANINLCKDLADATGKCASCYF